MCVAYTIDRAGAAADCARKLARKGRAKTGQPRWKVRPTDPAVVVTSGAREEVELGWGWRGTWGGPEARAGVLTCARSETLLQKPAFKTAVQAQRAVMIASGFFELHGRKWPHLFRTDQPAFAMAALWRPATVDGPAACILVTTAPNTVMAPIHDRMPVVLDDDAAELWLGDARLSANDLAELCQPFDATRMSRHAVDPGLLTKGFDGPACVTPWTPAQTELF